MNNLYGDAARKHLAAGRPIYTRDTDTPPGHVIKTYPDGRCELLQVNDDGSVQVISSLPRTQIPSSL
jgi:hypothetical protein